MLVQKQNLAEVAKAITEGYWSLDTETTGLQPYLGDRLFSIIVSNGKEAYYFNTLAYPDFGWEGVLTLDEIRDCLAPALSNEKITWFMHNAKFDLAILYMAQMEVAGPVHCSEAIHRLVYNDKLSYSLDQCAKDIGLSKDDAVEEYIKKHKLYEKISVPGKKKKVTNKFFDKVPPEVIIPYGEQDAKVTHALGMWQLSQINIMSQRMNKNIWDVYHNEVQLTKTCFEMEKAGAPVDKEYSQKAFSHEMEKVDRAMADFKHKTGMDFVDSGKRLAEAFAKLGQAYPKTKKGNPSFTDKILEGFHSPLAEVVREYRGASKKANTYYRNFIDMADDNGLIHANIRQGGTTSGRFSYSEPNLQNLPKEEDSSQEFIVRRCFIPPKDYCLVMIDYDQMEYRMMLDYAGETGVIDLILKEGLDVHEATAESVGHRLTRQQAKTLNFMLLYGGGIDKLAGMLNIRKYEAEELRNIYFMKLPKVKRFSKRVRDMIKDRSYIYNWAGRVYRFKNHGQVYVDGELKDISYKGPNYLIQGGCADVVKIAMNKNAVTLEGKRSEMLTQVHDEIVFAIHKDEFDLIPQLKVNMHTVYPHRFLPLTCSVDHSWVSWGDKVKGYPDGKEAGDSLQRAGTAGS